MEPMKILTQGSTTLTALSFIAALAVSLVLSASAQTASSTPLTADQIAARRALAKANMEESLRELQEATSNMMAQAEQQLANYRKTHPARTAAQTAAQQEAAQQASLAIFNEEVSPWLHFPLALPDGTDWTYETELGYQQQQLSALAAGYNESSQAAANEAADWSAYTGEPVTATQDGERTVTLMGFQYDVPILIKPDDIFEADTVSTDEVWPGGATGLSLTGTNKTIGMWDESSVRTTHIEFATGARVTQRDGVTLLTAHPTEVAGVLAAAGTATLTINGTNYAHAAKGMSFEAQISVYDYNFDSAEMAAAAATNAFQISNHSYGPTCGWFYYAQSNVWRWAGITNLSQNEDWQFGFYHPETAIRDQIVANAPRYLPVWSAGNDRFEAPPVQPTNHQIFDITSQQWKTFPLISRNSDGDSGGYDTLHWLATAKNVLTVGACYDIFGGYSGTQSVVLAQFSGCGPTDDGRIKPDVTAPGVSAVMPYASTDTAYVIDSGTSFSSPTVAGSLNLLAQLRGQLHPTARPFLASALKALAIHTADEAGGARGPDYQFGWGLFNERTAAELIRANATNGWKSFIKEIVLTNGGTCEFPVVSSGTQALKVTIAWTDPAGPAPGFASIDPTASMLVNDLDLRVIAPGGSTTNFPWVLNPDLTNKTSAARSAAATTGDDSRNNVEQVYLATPTAGTYTVRVTHKGTLSGGQPQPFALMVSGNIAQPKPPLQIKSISLSGTSQLALLWPAVVGQYYVVQSRDTVASGQWSNATAEISATKTNVAVLLPFSASIPQRFYRVQEVE